MFFSWPLPLAVALAHQLGVLLLLALPVACASWTVTHEEVFREPREFCKRMSQDCKSLPQRKIFYLFTCEYCFSHYVTLIVLVFARFHLLYTGVFGYVLAWFGMVYLANFYMSFYNRLRLDIKHENVEIAVENQALPETLRK